MATLNVRNIDDNIYEKIKLEAKRRNQSISDFIKDMLEDYFIKGKIIETEDKYKNFAETMLELYKADHNSIIAEREHYDLTCNRLMDLIEKYDK